MRYFYNNSDRIHYEIKAAVLDLSRFASKDAGFYKKVQVKYVQLIDRFFRENESFIEPQQRQSCLHDPCHFLSLMELAVERYYFEVEK
jgi:hypothetical protein